jgi:hypothetical protein
MYEFITRQPSQVEPIVPAQTSLKIPAEMHSSASIRYVYGNE